MATTNIRRKLKKRDLNARSHLCLFPENLKTVLTQLTFVYLTPIQCFANVMARSSEKNLLKCWSTWVCVQSVVSFNTKPCCEPWRDLSHSEANFQSGRSFRNSERMVQSSETNNHMGRERNQQTKAMRKQRKKSKRSNVRHTRKITQRSKQHQIFSNHRSCWFHSK